MDRLRVNTAVLTRLVADLGEDQVADLCGVFLADARAGVRAMGAACASGDAAAVAGTAHRLKSSCAFVAADAMSDLCAQIERPARDGELDGVDRQIELLAGELELTAAELVSLVAPVT